VMKADQSKVNIHISRVIMDLLDTCQQLSECLTEIQISLQIREAGGLKRIFFSDRHF